MQQDKNKKISRGLILGAVVALATGLSACVSTGGAPSATASPTVARSGFGGILNAERGSRGLSLLSEDSALKAAAQAHANDMVSRGYFSHQSLGGGNPTSRMRAAGGCRSANAENIAQGQSSNAAVFSAWMQSSAHQRNMLNGSYSRYGLGRSGNTWVLVLAGPCV